MSRCCRIGVVFFLASFAARPARADLFLVPWIGGNAGTAAGGSPIDVGAAAGVSAGGVVDVDAEVGYSPDYWGHGTSVLTAMVDVTIWIPIGPREGLRFRPYLTGGAGMIRSRVEAVPAPYRADWYETGGAFGGGLAVFTAARVGVRGDVRYIQAFSGGLNYWRTAVGVVFR